MDTKFTIIEDKPKLAQNYSSEMEIEDHVDKIIYISSLNQALESISPDNTKSVFWVDMNLGFADDEGLFVLRQIKKNSPESLVIVYTAHHDYYDRCLKVGLKYFHFINKDPDTYEDDMEKIKKIILNFIDVTPALEFYGQIAHIDTDSNYVKIDCLIDEQICQKYFTLDFIQKSIESKLKVDVMLRIRIFEKPNKIEILVHEVADSNLEDLQKLISDGIVDDGFDEEDLDDLFTSEIWNNKL